MVNDFPVFIKLDGYNEVLTIVSVIEKKIDETKEKLSQIKQLKEEENHEITALENNLKEVHQKIETVNEILKEPKF